MKRICLVFVIIMPWVGQMVHGQAYRYRLVSTDASSIDEQTVVGHIRSHTIARGETLLDISRHYGLGFNELNIRYSELDEWIPPVGFEMKIPNRWVLPSTKYSGIVINLAELRLYRFFPRLEMVKTYPIAIGEPGFETPEGVYWVTEKEVDPTWIVPVSLRKHYDCISVPPGPKNPLGKYWLGLSHKGYGIHGTNFPWSVGRLVSHGCVRLYPEHIAQLVQEVSVGTMVEVVYQPVKVGIQGKRLFLEVHPDVYARGIDMEEYARKRLLALGLLDDVSVEKMKVALHTQHGVPVQIGTIEDPAASCRECTRLIGSEGR